MLQRAASSAAVGQGKAAAAGEPGCCSSRNISSSRMIGCRAAGRLVATFGRSRGLYNAVGSNRRVGVPALAGGRAGCRMLRTLSGKK